ncbi:penicillin-binding transpeptidase domain-containing protein [Streptomyces sp. NPDC003077]|uniref:penicillin-binding transpeptidase domain-containing protein n=1 Tax=Streptomyces sp. NPDC003077 TaxID=3154443 RepID=UPI00339E8388
MRTGAKVVVGAVAAAVVGVAGVGGYNIFEALADGNTGSGNVNGPEPVRTGPPTAEEIRTTTRDFLAAWAKGDASGAAALTDNAEGATQALTTFREEARVARLRLTPGKPTGNRVPFHVTAEFEMEVEKDGGGVSVRHSTWSYDSSLAVVRGRTTGNALVDWQAAILHPKLRRGENLRTGAGGAPPIRAVDRDGAPLDAGAYPSLSAVLPALREKYGEKAGGVAGVEVRITDENGLPGETLHTVAEGRKAVLRTTLDARVQRAAEAAVKDYPEASVVAVKPTTGEILAVANHRADGFNAAFEGRMAPGSTMKVVSAALLMEKGLVSAGKVVECPKFVTGGGRRFHNLDYLSIRGGTFAESFARSCNTAFIGFADGLTGEDLAEEANEVFGLGRDWQAGVPTFDGSVPPSEGADTPAALIGQGRIEVNPLNMASVAATAKAGYFVQPRLVPAGLDDRPRIQAERALSPSVARQLRAMMRRTAVSGTARHVMAGLPGNIGAKTGSAEADGQGDANSWFLGYRNDAAAAAVVQQGGHGGDAAGPIVRRVLGASR